MATKTTFSFNNYSSENSAKMLWWFGLAEGIIAIVQSAEWLYEYQWAVRILPVLAFILAQVKLLYKTEQIGVKEVGKIIADEGADVKIVSSETNLN